MGKKKISLANLDFRINPELKRALEQYCEINLEKPTEVINRAIKELVGFGDIQPKKVDIEFEADKGKSVRMNVRTHPLLKDALDQYCQKNAQTYTNVITKAIKLYIEVGSL